MTRRGRKHLLKPLVFILAAVALEGCISPSADSVGRYTAPIGGSPVISNETPYSSALRCMGGIVGQHPVRIAVGQIADYTGKTESDGSGRKVTAGAALMAMSALSKSGIHMVERFDTSVAEMELKYANNKLIAADQNPQTGDYRRIIAGAIPGSDYYIVGGITELNFNVRSENASGNGGGTATNATTGTLSGSLYVMNVGLDMRLVNTNTLEVADVISYQKQIIGRQVSAGIFDFLGTNFFDISAGESALEPIQLAVRSVIERGILEMVTRIYRAPAGACASPIGTAADPLADYAPNPYGNQAYAYPARPSPYQPNPYPQQAFYPAYNQENYNDSARQSPYRGYGSSDPVGNVRLRGAY
ncbi:MAG TPA: holdfast anchoring protein HfaB [Rhizomicrobium sp.]|jgi:curli biogenesis system outer membrane secretion channel CsgG|nr:holdfast anchoring protein HfaB [Rhizomicrobium sp.]